MVFFPPRVTVRRNCADGGAGELDPCRCRRDFDRAASAPAARHHETAGIWGPGQLLQLPVQRGHVALHRHQCSPGTSGRRRVRRCQFRVQRVHGDHGPGQVGEGPQQVPDGGIRSTGRDRDLPEHRTGAVRQGRDQMWSLPPLRLAPRTVLPSTAITSRPPPARPVSTARGLYDRIQPVGVDHGEQPETSTHRRPRGSRPASSTRSRRRRPIARSRQTTATQCHHRRKPHREHAHQRGAYRACDGDRAPREQIQQVLATSGGKQMKMSSAVVLAAAMVSVRTSIESRGPHPPLANTQNPPTDQ